MKLVLRLLTVSSYFLPFTFFVVTCSNPLDVEFSYNQAEVDKNVMLAESYPKAQIVSTSEQDSVSQKTFNEENSTSQTGPSDSTVVETGLMELSDRTKGSQFCYWALNSYLNGRGIWSKSQDEIDIAQGFALSI